MLENDFAPNQTHIGRYFYQVGDLSYLGLGLCFFEFQVGPIPNDYYQIILGEEFYFYNPWNRSNAPDYTWGDNWYDYEDARSENLPTAIEVNGNYPNPFNASTSITFALPEPSQVKLNVYNLTGQLVDDVIDARMTAGEHNLHWDGSTYPSGVYYYKLVIGENVFDGKMTLLK